MSSVPSFFREDPAANAASEEEFDRRYLRYRDGTDQLSIAVREMVEAFWRGAAPYLDPNLPSAATRNFIGAFWEMDLAQTFLAHHIPLIEKKRSKGPDLVIAENPAVHVEATTATPGHPSQADHVPSIFGKPDDEPTWNVPHDQFILRLRNSIETKRLQREKRLRDGTLAASDPFIIAINASEIDCARLERFVPDIVYAVLPFGDSYLTIEVPSGREVGGGHHRREEILKRSGNPVTTTVFQDPAYDWISAILYSDWDEVNRRDEPGAGITVIRNPRATPNQIRDNLFPFGRHYVVSSDGLTLTPEYRSPLGSRLLFQKELLEANVGTLPNGTPSA